MSHSMDIWHGLIVYSPDYGLRRSALVVHGFTRLSPSIRSDSIRILTSSQHIALKMQCSLKRANRNISTRGMYGFQLSTIRYRAKRLNALAPTVDWDGSMIYHGLPVLKLALGTWQSICLRRQSLRRYGLKGGSAFDILIHGLNSPK